MKATLIEEIRPRLTSRLKFNKSDVLNEDRHGLKAWLIQIKLYFKFNKIADDEKVFFATTYFRERAEHWIQPTSKEYLDKDSEAVALFAFFFRFKKEFRRIFGVFNEEQTAERVIQHLTQKTSASDYAFYFSELHWLNNYEPGIFTRLFITKKSFFTIFIIIVSCQTMIYVSLKFSLIRNDFKLRSVLSDEQKFKSYFSQWLIIESCWQQMTFAQW